MVSALVFQTKDASSILVICSIYNCSDGVVGGARRLAKAKAFASSILVHCSKIYLIVTLRVASFNWLEQKFFRFFMWVRVPLLNSLNNFLQIYMAR